ncbi:hypothetical protein K470DRAFT_231932 [Piedraia hortae CBS 480.64]|uniref:Thioesterase domain-containing protein n=1 Tax=Piedraia hortae CBS 480.64 TaxID=1314780 RepID=A0A6A7C0L9_9PEZI|nr:hypothetical protein K470DRAFT_231932 [Piedraia hortae CBS 480.64]
MSGLLRPRVIGSAAALATGLVGGNMVAHTIAPPAMPERGSHEDKVLMEDLRRRLDDNFKVNVLRGKCNNARGKLKGEDGSGWVEVTENLSGSNSYKTQLGGVKGLGLQRVFWNSTANKLVAVIWFGPGLTGWPGVVHGGMIATEMTGKMGLAAALARSGPTRWQEPQVPAPAEEEDPIELELQYVKPTLANRFYVVRVTAIADDASERDLEATLETLEAETCVKAKATFRPGSIRPIEGGSVDQREDKAKSFREWMWPSRQKASLELR